MSVFKKITREDVLSDCITKITRNVVCENAAAKLERIVTNDTGIIFQMLIELI